MTDTYNVAIMGATGAVGQVLLEILAERDFPIGELRLLASTRSAGRTISFNGGSIQVQELGEDSFAGVDIVLASAGGGLSKRFNPHAVAAGAVVVDNTSAYRMDPDVPLVVPEINPEDLAAHRGIIANPNCSTIIMDVAVWPLHQRRRIKRIVVSTYQAVSGAGARAMQELETQTRQVLAGQKAEPAEFPHPIAFNLFSHDSAVGPEGYCEEELKMVRETRKMFHDDALQISATTIRVPVLRAHSEAINVEFDANPFRPLRPKVSWRRLRACGSWMIRRRTISPCRLRPLAATRCWSGAFARIFRGPRGPGWTCGSAAISCAKVRP